MGKDARSKELTGVGQQAGTWYDELRGSQTPLEKEYIPQSQEMWNTYMTGKDRNMADYGNIMGGYQDFSKNLGGPTKFNYRNVSAERPAELGESYGYLRETMPGYREFAQTGGYSPTDIQELRARGVSPIRAAYGNTMMELNRARALGGAGGAPNYIAAASKAQREMPGQMADAMTGVNAELANAIRQGKLAGLGGMANVGGTMGGMAGQEAGRMLQASMANQNADLQAQQLSEQSLQNLNANRLAALHGQTSLYGTTPALAATFGNQALQAYNQRIALEQLRNQTGLGLLGRQIEAYGGQSQQDPWWKEALKGAGSVLPYLMNNNKTGGNQMGPMGSTPMGNYSPNGMGGQQFTGFQANMPTGTPGNYQPQTSGRVAGYTIDGQYYPPGPNDYFNQDYFNQSGYDTWNDPYLNPNLGLGWQGGGWDTGEGYQPWNGNFGGWAGPAWNDWGPEYAGPAYDYNPWDWGTDVGMG